MTVNFKNNSKKEVLRKYLNIVGLLNKHKLSPTEVEVLINFLLLPEKFKDKRFGPLAKKKILPIMTNLSRKNLDRAIRSIYNKGFLRDDEDGVRYPRVFISKTVELLDKAIKEGKSYNINIKFSYDKEESGQDIPEDSKGS